MAGVRCLFLLLLGAWEERHTERKTGRQTQIDGQTERRTKRQTDGHERRKTGRKVRTSVLQSDSFLEKEELAYLLPLLLVLLLFLAVS